MKGYDWNWPAVQRHWRFFCRLRAAWRGCRIAQSPWCLSGRGAPEENSWNRSVSVSTQNCHLDNCWLDDGRSAVHRLQFGLPMRKHPVSSAIMIHIKSYESVTMILVAHIDEDKGMMFRMFLLQKPEGESRLLSWFERCRQYHVSSRLKSNCINISNPF